jgi:hypothetical protein
MGGARGRASACRTSAVTMSETRRRPEDLRRMAHEGPAAAVGSTPLEPRWNNSAPAASIAATWRETADCV